MIWKKQPVGSKLADLQDNLANYTLEDGSQKAVANEDLNTLTSSGRYTINSSCTNKPSNTGGYMDVYKYIDGYIKQVFYGVNNPSVYTRYCFAGTWYGWNELALSSKIPTSNVFDEILISAGSDLNNYRTPGTFIVPSDSVASQISNMPLSASGRLIVMNRTTSSYMVQEYYPSTSAPLKYVRNYNNGTWTNWNLFAFDDSRNIYSITLNSGWSAGTYEVIKIGRVCILQVNQLKTTTTSSGWKQAGTLDANTKPSGRIWGYFACDTSLSAGKATVAEVRVNTDRTVEVYAPQANEAYWGGFAYFCD